MPGSLISRAQCDRHANIYQFQHCPFSCQLPIATFLLQLRLVLTHDAALYTLLKDIHLCLGKLPRGHLVLKQDVQLGERPAPWLGETEVRVDNAKKAYSSLFSW